MSAYAAENRLRRWFTGEEHTNMKLTIPSNAEKILQVLNENGHEAYVVGGCVRDSILDRNPNDWDITTSASPYQVKELFPRTIDTGLQHGTVTVMMDKEGYEVTTYRDGRRIRRWPSSEAGDVYFKSGGGSEAQRFYDQCHGIPSDRKDLSIFLTGWMI